jgi:alkylation response protein AidB-like acyl-CoA dehydrogenase
MEREALYQPNREQLALIEALDAPFAELLPLSRLHAAPGETAATWSALRELGVFGIGVSEEQGGSGLGATEEALMALSLGRQLAAPSVLATLGAAHASLRPAAEGQAPRAALGYRSGGRIIAVDDGETEWLVVRNASGAALYERPELGEAVDDYLWGVTLRVAEPTAEIGVFDAATALRLRLLDAAALAGLARAALDMAVDYALVREQFGRQIGSFQAVKHHCANMAIAATAARDQTSFAAVAIDADREDAELQVECALLVAGKAALENAATNIQIHGGIGFSDEANPHLLVKRAKLLITAAGGLEAVSERIADIGTSW